MVCTVRELITQFKISEENIPLSVLEFTLPDDDKSHFNKGNRNENVLYFTGEYLPVWNDEDNKKKVNLELIIDLTGISNKIKIFDDFYEDKLNDNDMEYGDLILKELQLERIKFTYTMKDNFTGFESYNIFGGLIKQA